VESLEDGHYYKLDSENGGFVALDLSEYAFFAYSGGFADADSSYALKRRPSCPPPSLTIRATGRSILTIAVLANNRHRFVVLLPIGAKIMAAVDEALAAFVTPEAAAWAIPFANAAKQAAAPIAELTDIFSMYDGLVETHTDSRACTDAFCDIIHPRWAALNEELEEIISCNSLFCEDIMDTVTNEMQRLFVSVSMTRALLSESAPDQSL
jgi:hypothetical protein